MPKQYTPNTYKLEALNTINNLKKQWDDASVYVTEKDQYLMRKVIDQARRYYNGVFEKPYDEVTGEKKVWVPMTETAVEQVRKSIDLDTKDILILPGTPSAVGITPLVRSSILQVMKKVEFGQLLNDIGLGVARDGTAVVKTWVDINPITKKRYIRSELVDVLNMWVDPSAKSLQSTSVIHRDGYTEFDMQAYDGVWDNLDSVEYTTNLQKIYNVFNVRHGTQMPETYVWEYWGKIKKSWITERSSDDNVWINGQIVASGVNGASVIHYIAKNKREDGRHPFEEARYRKINGRWYGRGIPEMLFNLQEYVNTIINIRKANNLVLQNGIFLIRKGRGITPEMLSSITAGGGLQVTDVDNDIKQLPVQDFRQSSYTDEDRTLLAADRVTGAFDIGRGEVGRASASATATLTRDRNIRDTFVQVQEEIGFFIERLIVNHYIPLIKEVMTSKDYIKVTGDADVLTMIDDQIVKNRLSKFIQNNIEKTGFYPEPQEIQTFITKQASKLSQDGKQRFVQYFREIFDEEVDVEVHVTDEKFNRIVAAQQLRDALLAYSRLPVASKLDPDAILRQLFEIVGVKGEFFLQKPQMPLHAIKQNIAEIGRLEKEFAEGLPTELGAQQDALGISQQGPVDIAQPLQSRLNIDTRLGQL